MIKTGNSGDKEKGPRDLKKKKNQETWPKTT